MSFEVEQVFIEDSVNSSISAINNYNLSSSSGSSSNELTYTYINFTESEQTKNVDLNYDVNVINTDENLDVLNLKCQAGSIDGKEITICGGTNLSEFNLMVYNNTTTTPQYIYNFPTGNSAVTLMWSAIVLKWIQIGGNILPAA